MFAVGIISYYPGLAVLKVTTPVISTNSLGVMIIPGNYIFIFAFYSAIIFLIASSFLVGLNLALMFYSRNIISKSCSNNIRITNVAKEGVFGILPTFFTSFSCCGGGLLAIVIGPTAFSALALYSGYMASLTIAVLSIGTVLMSMKISKSYSTDLNCCKATGGKA
jgi:hypothetical protein